MSRTRDFWCAILDGSRIAPVKVAAFYQKALMVTPPVLVLIAFLWRPLVMPGGDAIYMVEFCTPGGDARHAISRQPVPMLDLTGVPAVLHAEIGGGSVIRLNLVTVGIATVVKTVQIVSLKVHNPFQEAA